MVPNQALETQMAAKSSPGALNNSKSSLGGLNAFKSIPGGPKWVQIKPWRPEWLQNGCNVGLEGANPRKGRFREEIGRREAQGGRGVEL